MLSKSCLRRPQSPSFVSALFHMSDWESNSEMCAFFSVLLLIGAGWGMIDNNRARKWPLIAGLFHASPCHLLIFLTHVHTAHRTCYPLRSVLWPVALLHVVRCCGHSGALRDAVCGLHYVDAVDADSQYQGRGLCSQDRDRQGPRQQRHRARHERPAPHVREGALSASDGHAHVCFFPLSPQEFS